MRREDAVGEPAHRSEAGEIGKQDLDPVRIRPLGDEPPRPFGTTGITPTITRRKPARAKPSAV